jgi:hypothetical protein
MTKQTCSMMLPYEYTSVSSLQSTDWFPSPSGTWNSSGAAHRTLPREDDIKNEVPKNSWCMVARPKSARQALPLASIRTLVFTRCRWISEDVIDTSSQNMTHTPVRSPWITIWLWTERDGTEIPNQEPGLNSLTVMQPRGDLAQLFEFVVRSRLAIQTCCTNQLYSCRKTWITCKIVT